MIVGYVLKEPGRLDERSASESCQDLISGPGDSHHRHAELGHSPEEFGQRVESGRIDCADALEVERSGRRRVPVR